MYLGVWSSRFCLVSHSEKDPKWLGQMWRAVTARSKVAFGTPTRCEIFDQLSPWPRSRSTFDSGMDVRGRPRRIPFARAFRNPALTLS
jgi:hypothetical protein